MIHLLYFKVQLVDGMLNESKNINMHNLNP